MTRTALIPIVAATLVLTARVHAADVEKKTEKPPLTCGQIVENYKDGKSVDQTSSQLLVDQSVVVACLKAAGIETPNEYDR